MIRDGHLPLSLLILASVCSSRSLGAIVYSQASPAQPLASFASENSAGAQKIADGFSFLGSESLTIRSVRFIGGYGLTSPPPSTPSLGALPPDAFHVTFFEDLGGLPGQPLEDGTFLGTAVVRAPTEGPMLNDVYAPIEYVVGLGEGVVVSPSTTYWLSISNVVGDDYFWTWARADGGIDNVVVGTFGEIEFGPWSVGSGGGMFFELDTRLVPEPSGQSLCALVAGLLVSPMHKKTI